MEGAFAPPGPAPSSITVLRGRPAGYVSPGGGDCFVAAMRVVADLHTQGQRVLLCHGQPIGTGPLVGKRFWHAWAEAKVNGGWLVLDYANGRQLQVRRADYYRIGSIGQDGYRVTRYSPWEAAKLATSWGHHGPWVELPADAL